MALLLRDAKMFEAGDLEEDIQRLQGPKATSLFTDEKGHAGDILVDTGTRFGSMVHGVDPMDMPEFTHGKQIFESSQIQFLKAEQTYHEVLEFVDLTQPKTDRKIGPRERPLSDN